MAPGLAARYRSQADSEQISKLDERTVLHYVHRPLRAQSLCFGGGHSGAERRENDLGVRPVKSSKVFEGGALPRLISISHAMVQGIQLERLQRQPNGESLPPQ